MSNVKKTLLSLGAVAAVAALATGGTFAVFTDADSIASNDIDSGSVVVSLDGSDTPVIDADGLAIGDWKTGTLVVTNGGENAADFDLSGAWTEATTAGLPENAVDIEVTGDGANVNEGLEAFNDVAGGMTIGRLQPGESRTYTVELKLAGYGDDDLDNAIQDTSGSQTFTVDAVQRNGEDRSDDGTSGNPDAPATP